MFDRPLRRWPLKALALGLAFAVWIAVTGEGRTVQDFRVPVDVALGDRAILAGSPPLQVEVRLRAPESVLRRVDSYDMDVRVDLRSLAPGSHVVDLTPRLVAGVPRDAEVVRIEPDRIKLDVARKVRREVPVTPTLTGRPPRGYALYRATPRPEALLIEGPESKVGAATRLRTEPIAVDGRREPFVARVAAIAETADVRVVDARPLDVGVQIDLAPVDAAIARVPVVVAGSAEGASASPSTVTVTVLAPSALIPDLRAGHLRAVAEVGTGAAGASLAATPLRVEVVGLDADDRAKVTVKSINPATVRVRRP